MTDLNVNPSEKTPEIPAWVKWVGTAVIGTIVSWRVSKALERYEELKQTEHHNIPYHPTNP